MQILKVLVSKTEKQITEIKPGTLGPALQVTIYIGCFKCYIFPRIFFAPCAVLSFDAEKAFDR